MKDVLRYLLVYLMWFVVLASGLWMGIIAREVLLAAMTRIVMETYREIATARFVHHCFLVLAGLGLIGLIAAAEEYFRRGVRYGDLVWRFARVEGPLLLAIVVMDLVLLLLQEGADSLQRWLIILGGLACGLSLMLYGRYARPGKNPPALLPE